MFINYFSQRLFGCIYAHKVGGGPPLDLCDRIIFDFNMNVNDNDSYYDTAQRGANEKEQS